MFSHRRSGGRRARLGAATLELALTLPVFLTMVVGIIECGRGFMVQQMVTNAAREGARHGVLPGATNADVVAKAKNYLATGRVDPAKVEVTVTPANLQAAKTGAQVKVHVGVRYMDVTWMPAPWFLGQANLTSETTMRHE
jgi:Flp pilus assembly protein TadG